jgi:hypothetical protein
MKRKTIIASEQKWSCGCARKMPHTRRTIRSEVRKKEPQGLAEFLVVLQSAASVGWTVLQARPSPRRPPPSSSVSRRTARRLRVLELHQSGERPER